MKQNLVPSVFVRLIFGLHIAFRYYKQIAHFNTSRCFTIFSLKVFNSQPNFSLKKYMATSPNRSSTRSMSIFCSQIE